MSIETLSFEAEVQQLLHLVAHSLYSNKEIFLRELISNASDAADKLNYEALQNNALYEGNSELKIWVNVDKAASTITIKDNGIGMTRDEVIANLGTIAKSGTRAFRELLKKNDQTQDKGEHLIGQFGVGFYSAFIVADKVVVRTRRAGMQANEGVEWESDGKGQYTLQNIVYEAHGTEVILHIQEEQKEFLEETRLRHIIRKYSDHILLPIVMPKIEVKTEENADKNEVVVPEEEVVNSANALWTLPKEDITEEQYAELYQHISHDFEKPLAHVHNKVEGAQEYTSVLYIPSRAPFDLWNKDQQRGLKLYVKRVFIMDDAEHFMPMYLRFVKGIIDSADLPLNISREILQSNKSIERIKTGCTKRILSLLEELVKKDAEKYKTFWSQFGQVLKEGPIEDFANKDRIAQLLRFASTHLNTDEQSVSLADYVSRMSEKQTKIFYITADTFNAAKNSPLLEVFRKKGIEVLLLSDRVDEWLMNHLTEFEGKKFQSVSQGKLDLDELGDEENEAQKQKQEEDQKTFSSLTERLKSALGEKVKEVRLTYRLTDSPACVVFDEQDLSGHMARILQAAGQEVNTTPILEINPEHALIHRLSMQEASDESLKKWATVLLNQALLSEGEGLKDPAEFVKALNQLLLDLA